MVIYKLLFPVEKNKESNRIFKSILYITLTNESEIFLLVPNS